MTDTKRSLSPLAIVLILSGVFFALFLVISGAMFLYRSPSTRGGHGGAAFFGQEAVGVVELNGVILESRKTLKKLERFEDDDGIKAVVLRLNSPGGAVAPSQEIYEAVRKYKKPLVVSMGSLAASGAFYIACGARKVFANPGTITGSIGVIMEFADLQKLYEWAKIQRYVIKTGKFKDAGAEYRAMTPEERELLQGMVDNVLQQFKQAVSTGRKLSMSQVAAIADGRIFSGSQAKEAKLVDELGTLQDAINDAGRLAHISGKPPVVYPEKNKRKWFEYLLDNGSGDEDSESSDSLQPRALGALTRLARELVGVQADVPAMEPGIYWLWGGSR